MLRITFIFIAFLLCTSSVYSQNKIGIKLGYSKSLSKATSLDFNNHPDLRIADYKYQSQDDVITIGISHITDLDNFFLMKEVMFRTVKYNFQMDTFDEGGGGSTQFTDTHHFIHIPIAAGVKVGPMELGAGPIFNITIDTEKEDIVNDTFTDKNRTLKTGFQLLSAININKHVRLDMKYEIAFSGVSDGYYYQDEKVLLKQSPNMFTIGLGFYL